MMKLIYTMFFIVFVSSMAVGQEEKPLASNNSISLFKNGFNKFQFYIGESKLLSEDIEILLKSNEAAYKYFQKGDNQSGLVSFLQLTGGFAIGLPLGSLVVGKEPKWWFAIGGAAGLIISIPISKSAYKNYKKAVKIYNESLTEVNSNK